MIGVRFEKTTKDIVLQIAKENALPISSVIRALVRCALETEVNTAAYLSHEMKIEKNRIKVAVDRMNDARTMHDIIRTQEVKNLRKKGMNIPQIARKLRMSSSYVIRKLGEQQC